MAGNWPNPRPDPEARRPDDFVDLIATAALDAAAHRAARRHRWVRIVGAMIRGLLVLLLLAVIVVTFAYW